jgi:hypothetical protein
LSAGAALFTFLAWRLYITPWPTALLIAAAAGTWSFFTPARSARALGSRSTRADSSSHPSFSAHATEESGLRLFKYFDLGVVAVDPQMGEGTISGLFN